MQQSNFESVTFRMTDTDDSIRKLQILLKEYIVKYTNSECNSLENLKKSTKDVDHNICVCSNVPSNKSFEASQSKCMHEKDSVNQCPHDKSAMRFDQSEKVSPMGECDEQINRNVGVISGRTSTCVNKIPSDTGDHIIKSCDMVNRFPTCVIAMDRNIVSSIECDRTPGSSSGTNALNEQKINEFKSDEAVVKKDTIDPSNREVSDGILSDNFIIKKFDPCDKIPLDSCENAVITDACTSRGCASSEQGICLVGLHCCGSLTPTMLKVTAHIPEIKALVCVSCCYHAMPVKGKLKRLSCYVLILHLTH